MLSISPRQDGRGLRASGRDLWVWIQDMMYLMGAPYYGTGRWLTVPTGIEEMTRIAITLRVWLRRAIKRINDRTVARLVDYCHHVRVELALSEMEIG